MIPVTKIKNYYYKKKILTSKSTITTSTKITLTISCWGTPSVMQTMRGISATIASIIASAAKGGGTNNNNNNNN